MNKFNNFEKGGGGGNHHQELKNYSSSHSIIIFTNGIVAKDNTWYKTKKEKMLVSLIFKYKISKFETLDYLIIEKEGGEENRYPGIKKCPSFSVIAMKKICQK